MSPGYGDYGGYGFRPYVSVGVRRARTQRALPRRLGKGKTAAPVVGQGPEPPERAQPEGPRDDGRIVKGVDDHHYQREIDEGKDATAHGPERCRDPEHR